MSRNHEDQISQLLHEGLGVEDIAIKLLLTVEQVRDEVKNLRADGILEEIYAS